MCLILYIRMVQNEIRDFDNESKNLMGLRLSICIGSLSSIMLLSFLCTWVFFTYRDASVFKNEMGLRVRESRRGISSEAYFVAT